MGDDDIIIYDDDIDITEYCNDWNNNWHSYNSMIDTDDMYSDNDIITVAGPNWTYNPPEHEDTNVVLNNNWHSYTEWQDMQELSKTQPSLRAALDQARMIYILSKQQNNINDEDVPF